MEFADLLNRLAIAIAIASGLLVGVERHWREREEAAGARTAGIRTYAIVGLLGGLAGALVAALGPQAGMLLVGFVFLGFTGALIAFRLREAEAEHSYSVTGVLAAQATFAIGALAVLGDPRVAGAAAVAMTALLASRDLLHRFVRHLRWVELRSAVMLLSMTFVALPLVPDRSFDVLGGLNPARVWRYAIVLGVVSYVGYLAVRLLGRARGRLLAGAATGLVSSTVATMTMARASSLAVRSEDAPLAAGALVAGAVSWLRTAALAWWVAPAMGVLLLPALLAGTVVQGVLAWIFSRGMHDAAAKPEAESENPFSFISVMKMALLLAAVGLASEFAAERFGGLGMAFVAAVSALADVDAVTLSMGALAQDGGAQAAATAVAVAVGANTAAKASYAIALGARGFAARFAGSSAGALAAGLAALLLV